MSGADLLVQDDALDGVVIPPAGSVPTLASNAQIEALAERVRAAHDAGEHSLKDAVKYFVRCGNLLLGAKAEMGHSRFGNFLKHNARLHPRTAQRYMLLARELPKLPAAKATRVSQLSLRDAVAELSRLSTKVAKLSAPGLDKALVDARHVPLKKAMTQAAGIERQPTTKMSTFPESLNDAPAAPAGASAMPPGELVEGILGHLYVYRHQHPAADIWMIVGALDEVSRRVQAGALTNMEAAK